MATAVATAVATASGGGRWLSTPLAWCSFAFLGWRGGRGGGGGGGGDGGRGGGEGGEGGEGGGGRGGPVLTVFVVKVETATPSLEASCEGWRASSCAC